MTFFNFIFKFSTFWQLWWQYVRSFTDSTCAHYIGWDVYKMKNIFSHTFIYNIWTDVLNAGGCEKTNIFCKRRWLINMNIATMIIAWMAKVLTVYNFLYCVLLSCTSIYIVYKTSNRTHNIVRDHTADATIMANYIVSCSSMFVRASFKCLLPDKSLWGSPSPMKSHNNFIYCYPYLYVLLYYIYRAVW